MSELSIYNWKDVTTEFKNACSELEIGEILKDETFSLFEAMSAIEMMDPKMDAGMIQNQSQSKIKSFKQAIDDNLVKIDNFTLEEKTAIVDHTYQNLVTWLDGSSLAQTLFTNMYLHDPNLVQDNYIKYFSIAILKIIDWMRNKIMIAATFEEEDFQPLNYNFKFANDISDSAVLTNLKSLEDTSAKFYRHVKSELKTDNVDKSEIEKQQIQIDLAHGLWFRMRFTKSLFQLMHFNDEFNNFSKNSEEISKHINICLETLIKIKETNKLGSQPEMVKLAKTTYPVVMGFEPSINQRLLPPTFPRFIRIQSFESTCEYLNELLTKLNELLKVPQLNTYHQLFDFGINFSRVQSVFLRSMFQLIALPRTPLDKGAVMKNMLLNTVKKFIAPPIFDSKCPLTNKDVCLQVVDNFLSKCTLSFVNLFQILGHNKARQREKLSHVFEEFSVLQEEADNLDSILHSFFVQQKIQQNHLACFGSWILYNNLQLMNIYLVSGFELELFSKFEFHYIYWYLCEIILNWQTNTLNRVDNFLLTAEINAAQKNNKKSKKKNKSFYEKEIALLTADRHMYSACYQSMRAFLLEGHIQSPNQDFDCEEFRYNHRVGPFQLFSTPGICIYSQFKDKDEYFIRAFEVKKLYAFAQEHFEMARLIYEKYPEHQTSAKIAKNNFVVMRLLSSGLKKVQKLELDFSDHHIVPLIRV